MLPSPKNVQLPSIFANIMVQCHVAGQPISSRKIFVVHRQSALDNNTDFLRDGPIIV